MNIYVVPPLITFILIAIEGYVVYSNDKRAKLNIIYSLFCLSLCIWLFGFCGMYLSKDSHSALFWARNGFFGIIFVPIFAYHFISAFLKIKKDWVLAFLYISSIPSLAVFRTDLVYKDVITHFWGYYPLAGKFYIFFLTCFLIGFGGGMLRLIIALGKKGGEALTQREKNQIKYLLFAFGVGTTGVVDYAIKFPFINIYPWGYLSAFGLITFFGLAIIKYQLLDIEILIKKTLVFAGLSAFVLGIIVVTSFVIQEILGNVIGMTKLWTHLLSAFIIIALYEQVKNFLVIITDKYLFQKKYDYRHLIREFMDELKTMVLNTTDIAQSTVDFLNPSVRPTFSAILMYNRFTSQYDLIASDDFRDKTFKVNANSELVKMLGDTGKILSVRSDKKLIPPENIAQIAALGIELIIPLLIHKELIGVLILGKKKSDEDYSNDDMEALSNLSGALSISLNNAQLFDERADAEKRALVGTIATGINHEVGNPLNIITIKLDTFRILAKEGLLAHKTKEEIISEVDKITKVCLESAQRIAEITKQVSEFAKPDKKLIFDKVNISETIDETMTLLKHGMILDIEKIEKRIMCDPVYILADRGQLKQILFNLIKNASHAIDKEKGKIVVTVDKNNNGEIAIKITDNGHGMSKEVRDKVFTPFFTTKEPGKGTGLGLALVKIMIDRNNAKIKVESDEEKGTTFTLIFKGGLL